MKEPYVLAPSDPRIHILERLPGPVLVAMTRSGYASQVISDSEMRLRFPWMDDELFMLSPDLSRRLAALTWIERGTQR